MISFIPGARIWLACGVTDMRNYALRFVMRSEPLSTCANAYQVKTIAFD